MQKIEEQKEKYYLITVGNFYWPDYCHSNPDICKYCWTDWAKGKPCIFYKRILVLDGMRVKIYLIRRARR